MTRRLDQRERLVRTVQRLESLVEAKHAAATELLEAFTAARSDGFDPKTLKVVLKLRQLSPAERQERRALEAIYMAALGMLEGEALPEAARRRLDGPSTPSPAPGQPPLHDADAPPASAEPETPSRPEQPTLALKDPAEARSEGEAAAAAGQRIYDNPYPASDPCRAAWDEGWCAERQSHGMETPAAFRRRAEKPAKDPKDGKGGPAAGADDDQKGAA